MLTFQYTGAGGLMTVPEILTTGMRGKQVLLEFSPEWEGLAKTVVFSNGEITRDVAFGGNPVTIPAEILEEPLKELTVGVYGLGIGGELAIPTIRARGPVILPGALPSGENAAEPAIPLWEQIQAQLGDPSELDTDTKENLVAAINEMWWRFQNHLTPDKTLTQEGMAADAKAVGDALDGLADALEQYFTDFKGIFLVGATDLVATHSASEILEAARMGMMPVLYGSYTDGASFVPMTRFQEGKALFDAPGIEDGIATVLTVAVDEEKRVTVALDFHRNSGSGQGSAGIIGAVGDGVTDDTLAFRAALASNRVVTVPGRTYKLSEELVVRDNCCLELAQDTVLNFTKTDGNCITLNRSASLKGNHATVNVPYGFTGHVINVDTSVHEDVKDVFPWTHWDPQWKTGRYLTDLNICMPGSNGLHQSADGSSFGTAVYISANRQGTGTVKSMFIWGLNFSGLRIAGAFEYGIRAHNYDANTWNHEMRIEALMDACKVGVSLENCPKAYISATVQARAATDGTVYAACGIQLMGSRDTDLTGSRVWDWGTNTTLWTYDKTNVHQHIAMYGDCRGTILNDYNYYQLPDGFRDIRELIYTDTPSNYDSLIIFQEPITKWFKPKEGLPYFNNGETEKQLCLYEDLQGHFQTDRVPLFDEKLAAAIGKDGPVLNGVGYIRNGRLWDASGNLITNASNGCTGLIPCKQGDVLRAAGLGFENADDNSRVLFFDANFNLLILVTRSNLIGGGNYYAGYEKTADGFKVTLLKGLSQAAYAAFNFKTANIGSSPVVSVNEEIQFTYSGFLADGIKVMANSVDGLDAAIEAKLGVIENGTY